MCAVQTDLERDGVKKKIPEPLSSLYVIPPGGQALPLEQGWENFLGQGPHSEIHNFKESHSIL